VSIIKGEYCVTIALCCLAWRSFC